MMRVPNRALSVAYEGEKGPRHMLHLRMVELLAFVVIVFGARHMADFVFRADLVLSVLIAAGILQLCGHIACVSRKRRQPAESDGGPKLCLWYSALVDLLCVLGIIYLTGTIGSPFLFLLVIPLFFASHIFSLRATIFGFLVAEVAVVAVLGYLEWRQVIVHFTCYRFGDDVYLNGNYYIGTMLVVTGFLSLILFLSNAFQDHFLTSIDTLRRRHKENTDKINELSRLYDVSLGINAVMTLETLLKMVAKEATILLAQPWASIVLFNEDQEITHSVIVGLPEEYRSKLGSKMRKGGLTEWIWKHEQPVVVEDVLADKRAATGEFLMATNARSLIGLPLNTGQRVIGAMYVGDFKPKTFEERHIRLLAIVSDQLVISIAKSKLYESLRRKLRGYEQKIEGLEKVNYLKSEYVSHVSHELRTPLTSIKAYMETLERHINDPKFVQRNNFLRIVSKETERLIRIVDDILDVSSIEFGQRALQVTGFGIDEVISAVVSMLQPKLDGNNTRVEIIAPENLPRVKADKDLITQVFVNLITNAIKYSPDGTTITIRVVEEAVDLAISIEDEGIGIPESELERIFEKYFRVKSPRSRQYDGVGLGLAIVKNIIEQHGGAITVTSEEHVGSKFTFSIPKEHCVNDLLGYISELVSDDGELHELLTLIVRMIAELLSAKIVSLMLLDHDRSELFIKVSYGLDEWIVDQARVKVGEGIAGKVAETGLPLLIDNIENNEVFVSPNNPQYETMSLLSVPLKIKDTVVGVINVNNKMSGTPFGRDDMNLLMSFADRIAVSLERLKLESEDVQLQETIGAFKRLLESELKTRTIEKKIDLTVKLARKLGLGEKDVKVVQYVASVHDIGMTKISDEILNKTFHLSSAEMEEIRTHPQAGTELIRPLEFVELVSNIILHHHERVDGSGYPMGLKGEQIPVGSRILAVVDAYQSMTSERPYRVEMSVTDAVEEIVRCAGEQFDREIVTSFVDVLRDEGKLSSKQTEAFRGRLDLHRKVNTKAPISRS